MFGEDQCPKHHCKLVDYSYMTDCGEEWDVECPICSKEHMDDMIAMAEEYGKSLARNNTS